MSAGQQTDRYPEHEKLARVRELSQALGEFLDVGLPRLGLVLYEEKTLACECGACAEGRGDEYLWHSTDERASAVNGVVPVRAWNPTSRLVSEILADYFEIDQAKIDAEKAEMLAALRSES